ncbi:hypothetical protein EXIGLDRAFT_840957 [Exidia glandulosa HHB12029]|uniref:Mid2 domain-containing protein n=1 Tax=Exidia glandulosa HHB12029 TaxID=1314781 RepID=A0A165E6Y7_EXIGL|nr:hypothetical protein EXIGLDRAFT_840957 [Exidia glandulosa HHB12029]
MTTHVSLRAAVFTLFLVAQAHASKLTVPSDVTQCKTVQFSWETDAGDGPVAILVASLERADGDFYQRRLNIAYRNGPSAPWLVDVPGGSAYEFTLLTANGNSVPQALLVHASDDTSCIPALLPGPGQRTEIIVATVQQSSTSTTAAASRTALPESSTTAPPATSESSTPKHATSTGVIAGVTILCIALVAAALAAFIYIRRRRRGARISNADISLLPYPPPPPSTSIRIDSKHGRGDSADHLLSTFVKAPLHRPTLAESEVSESVPDSTVIEENLRLRSAVAQLQDEVRELRYEDGEALPMYDPNPRPLAPRG